MLVKDDGMDVVIAVTSLVPVATDCVGFIEKKFVMNLPTGWVAVLLADMEDSIFEASLVRADVGVYSDVLLLAWLVIVLKLLLALTHVGQ